jgi:hypothetical protein
MLVYAWLPRMGGFWKGRMMVWIVEIKCGAEWVAYSLEDSRKLAREFVRAQGRRGDLRIRRYVRVE